MNGKVEISYREYAELKKALKTLSALQRAGVDNWEFYDDALSELREEQRKDEAVSDFACNAIEFLSTNADIYEPAGRGAGYGIYLDNETMDSFKVLIVSFIEDYNNKNRGEK